MFTLYYLTLCHDMVRMWLYMEMNCWLRMLMNIYFINYPLISQSQISNYPSVRVKSPIIPQSQSNLHYPSVRVKSPIITACIFMD